jgi:thiosulfate/3-mercaptopyruvate sulfurtransferase
LDELMPVAVDFPYPLATPEWLADVLGAGDLKIVDGSWRMPGNPPAHLDFERRRIPSAVFFDLDAIADQSTFLPHMLPSPEEFAARVGAVGIRRRDRVVIYDDAGLFSAARVWWTFRAMGHDLVCVLDGGLPKWTREGRALATGPHRTAAADYEIEQILPLARTAEEVRVMLESRSGVVLDARPAPRFAGVAAEPRPGLRSGHMPRAINLPHAATLTASGELRPVAELARLFRDLDVHTDTEIITTCGSGVTAAVLSLALERLGHRRHGLYDGSWAEWGGEANDSGRFPVVKG